MDEKDLKNVLGKIKERRPLIHNITNWVTIYDVANAIRMTGALPVMAHAKNEAEDMAKISSALVLNIGTLTDELIESMLLAGKAANKKGIPIVLDGVGAGATPYRTEKAKELLSKLRIDVIKGNKGEIAVIAGGEAEVRGVEAIGVSGDALSLMKKLAQKKNCCAVATGAVDLVTDGKTAYKISNGVPEMGGIVGTGCISTAIIGCFCSVEKDHAKASALALSYFGLAGELAAKKEKLPGSFKTGLFDSMYILANSEIIEGVKIEEERI